MLVHHEIVIFKSSRDCCQISKLILSAFKRILLSNPLKSLQNHFLMISGGTEVNQFAQICLILEAKFGKDP